MVRLCKIVTSSCQLNCIYNPFLDSLATQKTLKSRLENRVVISGKLRMWCETYLKERRPKAAEQLKKIFEIHIQFNS